MYLRNQQAVSKITSVGNTELGEHRQRLHRCLSGSWAIKSDEETVHGVRPPTGRPTHSVRESKDSAGRRGISKLS